ncbi:hypothetical protein KIPB_011299, partial [Kipferlia bialata]
AENNPNQENSSLNTTGGLQNARIFLAKVKAAYIHQPESYSEFLRLLSEYQARSWRTRTVCLRVTILFEPHPELLHDFLAFLPDVWQNIAVDRFGWPSKWPPQMHMDDVRERLRRGKLALATLEAEEQAAKQAHDDSDAEPVRERPAKRARSSRRRSRGERSDRQDSEYLGLEDTEETLAMKRASQNRRTRRELMANQSTRSRNRVSEREKERERDAILSNTLSTDELARNVRICCPKLRLRLLDISNDNKHLASLSSGPFPTPPRLLQPLTQQLQQKQKWHSLLAALVLLGGVAPVPKPVPVLVEGGPKRKQLMNEAEKWPKFGPSYRRIPRYTKEQYQRMTEAEFNRLMPSYEAQVPAEVPGDDVVDTYRKMCMGETVPEPDTLVQPKPEETVVPPPGSMAEAEANAVLDDPVETLQQKAFKRMCSEVLNTSFQTIPFGSERGRASGRNRRSNRRSSEEDDEREQVTKSILERPHLRVLRGSSYEARFHILQEERLDIEISLKRTQALVCTLQTWAGAYAPHLLSALQHNSRVPLARAALGL